MGGKLPGLPFCYVMVDGEDISYYITADVQRTTAENLIDANESDSDIRNLIYYNPSGALMLKPYIDYNSRKYDPALNPQLFDFSKYYTEDKKEVCPWSVIKDSAGVPYVLMKDTSVKCIGSNYDQKLERQLRQAPYFKVLSRWEWGEGINIGVKLFSIPADVEKNITDDNKKRGITKTKYLVPAAYFLFRLSRMLYKQNSDGSYTPEKGSNSSGYYLFEYDGKGNFSLLDIPDEYRSGKIPIEWIFNELCWELIPRGTVRGLDTASGGGYWGRDRFKTVQGGRFLIRRDEKGGKAITNLSFMFIENGITVNSGAPVTEIDSQTGEENRCWNPDFLYSAAFPLDNLMENTSDWKYDKDEGRWIRAGTQCFKHSTWKIETLTIGVKFASAAFFIHPISYPESGSFDFKIKKSKRMEDARDAEYELANEERFSWGANTIVGGSIISSLPKESEDEIKRTISLIPAKSKFKNGGYSEDICHWSPLFNYIEYHSPVRKKVVSREPVVFTPTSMNLTWDRTGYRGSVTFWNRTPAEEKRLLDYLSSVRPVTLIFGRAEINKDPTEIINEGLKNISERFFNLSSPTAPVAFRGYFYPTVSASRTGKESTVTVNFRDRMIAIDESMGFMLPIYDGWVDVDALRNLLNYAEYGEEKLYTDKSLLPRGEFRLPVGTMKSPKYMFPEGKRIGEAMREIAEFAVRWLIPFPDGRIVYADFAGFDQTYSLFEVGEHWETRNKFLEVSENPVDNKEFRDEIFRLGMNIDFSSTYNRIYVIGFTPFAEPEYGPNRELRWIVDPKKWRPILAVCPRETVLPDSGGVGSIPWRKIWIIRNSDINTDEYARFVADATYIRNAMPYYTIDFATWGRTDLIPLQLIEVVEKETNPGRVLSKISRDSLKPGLEKVYPEEGVLTRNVYRITSIAYNMTSDKKFTISFKAEKFFGSGYDYPLPYVLGD